MRYLLITAILLSCLASNAQQGKYNRLTNFAKEYFKHFQKKDFDWIMEHYATPYEIERYTIQKYPKYKSDPIMNMKVWNNTTKLYRNNLQKVYVNNSFISKSKVTDVFINNYSIFPKSTRVTITFKTAKGKYYQLIPAHWFLTERGKWVYYGNHISIYEKRNLKKEYASTITVRGDTSADLSAPVIKDIPIPDKPRATVGEYNEGNKIFIAVEQEATFPGGETGMYTYLSNNIFYPRIAKENEIAGIVYITFVVEKDGSISQAKIVRDIGGGCGTEALRVIKKMPKWKPARNNGKVVRSEFTIPIEFSTPE